MVKDFLKNGKEYINYLMKVNFKDLFINTIILLCIIVLSSLIYIPIGFLEDLIRSFIVVFTPFSGIPAMLYYWFFKLLEYVSCLIAFMFLFNKRFEDLEAFKEQVNGKEGRKIVIKNEKTKQVEEELELPKTK